MSVFYYDLYMSSRLFGVAHERIEKESPLTPEAVGALLFSACGGKASEDPAAFRGVLMGLREF